MTSGALSEASSFDPYWWRAAPPPDEPLPLPAKADVAIVGSGITGMVAALHLARAGKQVLVLEANSAGWGASSRNAGYVGRTLKHGFGELMQAHGLDHAKQVYRELMAAFLAVRDIIADEKIECHYRQHGRFLMATSPAMLNAMAAEFALREEHLGEPFTLIRRDSQGQEVATQLYHGGVRIDDHAGLHPGLYIAGLRRNAVAAGVQIITQTRVLAITRENKRFVFSTPRGLVRSGDAVVATNGYTDNLLPWLQRRVIPFDAYQTVSEALDPQLLDRLLPGGRTYIDWNFNVDWFRRAPGDATRLIFGGLTGGRNQDLRKMAGLLKQRLVRIFPELGGLRFDHVWTGRCAGTVDLNPHLGRHDGIHYGLGYCFAGVPMGTLFGKKIALRILGREGGDSVFDRPLPALPFYRGNPWFVPLAMRWLSRHDR